MVERDARRAHDLQRFRGHLGADAVPADDPDPMGHGHVSLHEKTAHAGVDGEANAKDGVRLRNDDYEV